MEQSSIRHWFSSLKRPIPSRKICNFTLHQMFPHLTHVLTFVWLEGVVVIPVQDLQTFWASSWKTLSWMLPVLRIVRLRVVMRHFWYLSWCLSFWNCSKILRGGLNNWILNFSWGQNGRLLFDFDILLSHWYPWKAESSFRPFNCNKLLIFFFFHR